MFTLPVDEFAFLFFFSPCVSLIVITDLPEKQGTVESIIYHIRLHPEDVELVLKSLNSYHIDMISEVTEEQHLASL